MCSILGIKGSPRMDYIRILAMNSKGRELLSEIKNSSNLTPVTKAADFIPNEDSMFSYDILATDIAALCSLTAALRVASKDYTTSPYVKKQ
jgi:hypothetical protein